MQTVLVLVARDRYEVRNGDENTEHLAMVVDGEIVYKASKQPSPQEGKATDPECEE
jgi:hypothetical protein